jgi:hypothetical protein
LTSFQPFLISEHCLCLIGPGVCGRTFCGRCFPLTDAQVIFGDLGATHGFSLCSECTAGSAVCDNVCDMCHVPSAICHLPRTIYLSSLVLSSFPSLISRPHLSALTCEHSALSAQLPAPSSQLFSLPITNLPCPLFRGLLFITSEQ